jgi:hypothetical protein
MIDWQASLTQLEPLTSWASIAADCGTSRQHIRAIASGVIKNPSHMLGHKLIGILANFELNPVETEK